MGENQTTRKSVVRAQRHAEVAKIMEQAGCKTCGTYGTTASSKCQLSVVAIGRIDVSSRKRTRSRISRSRSRNPGSPMSCLWMLKPSGEYSYALIGHVVSDPPELPRGGLLADVMGFGKTFAMVGVICLICTCHVRCQRLRTAMRS